MDTPAPPTPRGDVVVRSQEPSLNESALGFTGALSIGLNSTAPAYSLAAVIGSIAVAVGLQAPGALIASFVPMFLIAAAFYYMNRVDPDAGTSFSWVTRAMGPWAGWIGGWAICVTGILVVGSLADVGARYLYLLVGWDSAAGSKGAVTALAIGIIVLTTTICIIGTELSGRLQNVLVLGQVAALLIFAGAALAKIVSGDAPEGSAIPAASWFNPFAGDASKGLVTALLLGVFIYWGWESTVNLAEETKDSRRTSGLAAVTATVILLVTYLSVSTAVVGFGGLETLAEFDDDEGILGFLAGDVLGTPWDKIVVLAVSVSAIASTQTTIIPASRTTLSMARSDAMPRVLARIHPRFQTPHVSTAVVALLAILWYLPLNLVSENFLFDSISALSLMVAFYYSLSGIACAIFHRRELFKSAKNLLFIGVAPLVGAGLLAWLFVEASKGMLDPEDSYSGTSVGGVGLPFVIGIGFLALGAVLVVLWRLGGHERFFSRRPFEAVHPEVFAGRIVLAERTGLDDGALPEEAR